MANVRHSKARVLLAQAAAKEAGLAPATAEAAAADEDARAARDALWQEYERQLTDTQTYTLEAIQTWLESHGAKVSLASICRDRMPFKNREEKVAGASARTREVLALLEEADEGRLLAASRTRIAQLVFEFFGDLSADALDDLKPHQIVRLMETAGLLSRASADVGLSEARLAELRRKFDQEIRTREGKAGGDGRLSVEDIGQIREAVFGSAA